MADEELSVGGGEKKGGMLTWILLGVVAVALGGGGYFLGSRGKQADPVAQEKPAQPGTDPAQENAGGDAAGTREEPVDPTGKNAELAQEDTGTVQAGALLLDEFTVNLSDPFGRRFGNFLINLEVRDKTLIPKIKENELLMAKIRDEIFMIISSKSYNELNNVSGKETLKDEITIRVNERIHDAMGAEPIGAVYFVKFLMQ